MEIKSDYSAKKPIFYPEDAESRSRVMRDLICFRDMLDVTVSHKLLVFLEISLEAIMEMGRLITVFVFFCFSYFTFKFLDAPISEGITLGIFIGILMALAYVPSITIALTLKYEALEGIRTKNFPKITNSIYCGSVVLVVFYSLITVPVLLNMHKIL